MKFDELDAVMRIYETSHDYCVPPGIYMIARIDGRGFTRLTRERHPFKAPFDERFRDYMTDTVQHLMNTGFNIIYGYTQSDEISLLFHPQETLFSRKLRKYNSILAGEASAKFSVLLGDVAAFDCRISQLPNFNLVVNYFRWRNEDAHRNALNAWCYWTLREHGQDVQQATTATLGMSVASKNELLFRYGINFNDLPAWQKRGTGLYWTEYEKDGFNPITGETVVTRRRAIKVDTALPKGEEYNAFIRTFIGNFADA